MEKTKMGRCLVIEDDPYIRDALVSIAEELFGSVESVGTVREAEARIIDGGYKMLLLDLGLEDGSGFELLSAQSASADTSIIVVSSSMDIVLRERSFKAGARDFVSKPFSRAELLRRMERVLTSAG